MSERAYKLTDASGRTYGGMEWGDGVEHTAPGGELCSAGVLHAYRSPLVAAMLNPIHAAFRNPRLWEADGDVCCADGTKVGCTRLRTIREIPLSVITTEQRVRFAIYCAQAAGPQSKAWSCWAEQWLSGDDRSARSAEAARAAEAAARAAEAAARAAARAAAWAAAEAARAAEAMSDAGIDLHAIAERVLAGEEEQ